ncbi:acetaldehyde dehydrogenase [Lentisphaera araneosa HTCC2155]|uniref:Acetaldehyde dehydrogenase n=1 Tax=Lentisphaera araneosa HTCC2155 TaxID=313628 RepID=A6DT20_9BACT|nr:acetaldehyde dehydrogenase (acetylating) [Lentisphaera araneosa]EDM25195.1 acetaldehyde dehydrogenase [Lentisphaera araneosa HTCC2155]
MKKLKIAILGSGNIGTDLLIKVMRSKFLDCVLFVGRSFASNGMIKASSLGIIVSDKSIDAIVENKENIDLVFDATSAQSHKIHANIFKDLGIKCIDMTPSQVGKICIPAINGPSCLSAANINMITCGGQASIPMAYTIFRNVKNIEYIEVVSSIASKSAGPGTRENIDEYIYNTEAGLRHLTGCENVKAILNLNPAIPCINMQTTIFAKVDQVEVESLISPIKEMEKKIQEYVTGYEVIVQPVYEGGRIVVTVRCCGLGDYLPRYAGNLDIINCAAIAMAEEYAIKNSVVGQS